MISSEEIRTVKFEKTMRGYRCDDVDAFLQQVAQDTESLTEELETLKKHSEESDRQLYVLAQKIEEYRRDEDVLKTALLNAQRMGENVIREAKQKAEHILRDASIRAADLTQTAHEEAERNRRELERIQTEVAHFKTTVLGLYKQHIESLSTLPGEEEPAKEAEPQPAQPVPAPAAEQPSEEPAAQQPAAEQPAAPEAQPQPAEPEEAPGDTTVQFELPEQELAAAQKAAQAGQPAPEAPAHKDAPLPSILDGFQGVKFSD